MSYGHAFVHWAHLLFTVGLLAPSAKMNQRSSRSHTIFRLVVESKPDGPSDGGARSTTVSILNLVDLAGSESTKKVRVTLGRGGAFVKTVVPCVPLHSSQVSSSVICQVYE
jgi:hypothetical protein